MSNILILFVDVSLAAKAAEDCVAHPENEEVNGFSKQSSKKVIIYLPL